MFSIIIAGEQWDLWDIWAMDIMSLPIYNPSKIIDQGAIHDNQVLMDGTVKVLSMREVLYPGLKAPFIIQGVLSMRDSSIISSYLWIAHEGRHDPYSEGYYR